MIKLLLVILSSFLPFSASMPFSSTESSYSAYALEAESITATATKTFYVGETITSADIHVEDNLGNEITDFTFTEENHKFTYEEASSGGALTNVVFANAITGGGYTCSLTAQVQRKTAFDTRYDVIDNSIYGAWQNAGISQGNNVQYYDEGGADYYVYGSMNSASGYAMVIDHFDTYPQHYGIISKKSDKNVLEVRVVWNNYGTDGCKIRIYGKDTAYSSTDDLFDNSKCGTEIGTIIKGQSSSCTIEGEYKYIGICVKETPKAYLNSVTIIYDGIETTENVANYIMYEDTNDQCQTKFGVAKAHFENLTKGERVEFMTSDNYVLATARDRLEKWATALGKTITVNGGDYVITNSSNSIIPSASSELDAPIIVITTSIALLALISGWMIIKKKKQQ